MLAEDDPDQREIFARLLEAAGHEVVCVDDGDAVRAFIEEARTGDHLTRRVHVLVTDLQMPKMSGLEVLSYLDELGMELPTVLITGFGSPETFALARRLGAHAVLQKPLEPGALNRVLSEILEGTRVRGPTF